MVKEKTRYSVRKNGLPLTVEAFDVVFAHTPSGFDVTFIRAAGRVTRARPVGWRKGRAMREGTGGKKRHSHSRPFVGRVNTLFFKKRKNVIEQNK